MNLIKPLFRLNVFMFIKAKKHNSEKRDKSISNAWLAAVQIGGEGAAAKRLFAD